MVVNHQGEQSRRLHPLLAHKLSENITLYKQDEQMPDVWQTLGGDKDDFLVYDRCGRLTHHISLPYSIIGQGHVEGAIKDTYCNRICGDCTHESAETPEECKGRVEAPPNAHGAPAAEGNAARGHHHGRHHGHHHGHHHHGHGHGNHDGTGQSHDHDHSHHGLRPQGQSEQEVQVFQMQQHADIDQIQADAADTLQMHMMPQEDHGAPVRP
ncbi:hypothetical protein JOB18_018357 [Solea senegalensis]|uniref:Selenoprotein P N-terminal domain-containing protein n=4 Tax=Solea senegalensis TaxID=28829 RepID=A0AAV6QHC9_SOLSE|nr:hypothetical protein JOB18_018357 [Solea senegalensis]